MPQVAPVIIDDDCGSNGCYPNYAHVTMSTGTANATIFYTASTSGYVTPTHSGATPTGNTAIYSGPIEVVFQRKYFSAVGYKAGLNDSGVTQFDEDNTNPNLRPAPIQPAAASAAMGGGAAPEWSAPARTVGYVLDKAGNRLSVDESGVGTQSYVPNNLNQYESVDGMGVNHGASHETTGHEGVTYSYVGDTYLARAQAGANTYTLYYDALGRCVKRRLNGVSEYYLFDGEHWILEFDATGASASNVLYGLGIDEIIARGVSGQPQWPLPDRNGNTSVVTTNGGAILEQYRYDAFGAPTITDGSGAPLAASAIQNPFLFTGREWAPANLGFYEYRARAYHPGLGRFMSEDPIGFDAKDYNLFRYVGNDPLDKTDPMGLDFNFAAGSSSGNIASFNTAIRYISQERNMAGYIGSIRGHNIPVSFNDRFQNEILSNNGLRFDPSHGQQLRMGLQSPALILAHEMKHLYDQIKNPKGYMDILNRSNMRIGTKQREVTNDNERSALAAEKQTAQKLGEPYREASDYHKAGTPRSVPSVTTHTEIVKTIDSNIPIRVEKTGR